MEPTLHLPQHARRAKALAVLGAVLGSRLLGHWAIGPGATKYTTCSKPKVLRSDYERNRLIKSALGICVSSVCS